VYPFQQIKHASILQKSPGVIVKIDTVYLSGLITFSEWPASIPFIKATVTDNEYQIHIKYFYITDLY